MRFAIFLLSLIICLSIKAQTVSGTIRDNSETLVGATVVCDGLGTSTDLSGHYQLKLKSGKKNLEIRYFGYKDIKLQFNLIKDTIIDFTMTTLIRELEIVNIVAKTNKESNYELTNLQSKSSSVVDGVSAESFKKTPDSKASDVFKRISGATVQDGKFVVIRGLNDRYNFALINGTPLPSSESDKRAFSFDIFPSTMIDAITINKTATPDLPGEFSGGVINIKTTEPKDSNFTQINFNLGLNTITTFETFMNEKETGIGKIGFGSKSRELPKGLPSTAEYVNQSKSQKAEWSKLMTWNWTPEKSVSVPNFNLGTVLSRIKKSKIGNLQIYTGFNSSKNQQLNLTERRDFEEQDVVVKKMELKDSVFTTTYSSSAIMNFNLDINENHQIKFKNFATSNSENKINIRHGVRELDNDPRQWEKSTNFWYSQMVLTSHQLLGEHQVKKLKLNWNSSFNWTNKVIPNLRRVIYRKYSLLENDTNEQYVAVIQSNGTVPTASGNMFWSDSDEKLVSGSWNIEGPIKIKNWENIIKVGQFYQFRTRQFWSRNFGFSQYKPQGKQFNSQLLLLNSDEIFENENLGTLQDGRGGFKLDEATNVDDSYSANSFLHAGFLQADTKFKKIRVVGGVRLESHHQVFNWIEFASNLNKTVDTIVVDVIPSVNLIWSLTEKVKLRASYSKTVSRPEFRELAPFSFYNFVNDNIVSGDPYLKRCRIENLDFRFEYFGKSGQMVTISFFQKNFTNPIEMINRTGTSGAPELYLANVNSAVSYGGELEMRKNLLKGLTVYSNLAYIHSRVDMVGVVGTKSRPLQGQSPYILNTGIFWSWKDFEFNCSWNYIGPRIFIVGNVQEPSVWERGRHLLDIQLSKKIKKNLDIKLNVKDAIAQKAIFFQDLDENKKWSPGIDNNWQQTTFGSLINLSVKWQF